MAIKDNFLSEIKIGTNVELMIGSKEISGRIISLDVDTVKLEKDDGKRPSISLDAISYYEIVDSVPEKKQEQVIRPAAVTIQKGKYERLSFHCEIKYPKMGDFDIDNYFKSNLTVAERKVANRRYDSLKSKSKSRDFDGCKTVSSLMITDFDQSDAEITDNAYRFALFLQARYGDSVSFGVMSSISAYDFMAIYYYKAGDYSQAVYCACMALSGRIDSLFKNMMYSITVEGYEKNHDCSGIERLIRQDSSILLEPNMQELLKYIYTSNNLSFPTKLEKSAIIDDLNAFSQSNTVGRLMDIAIEKAKKQKSMPIDTTDKQTMTISDEHDSHSEEKTHLGDIIQLSWASEKGVIISDGSKFEFAYSDISDNNLLSEIKSKLTRYLEGSDIIPVDFKHKNGKVFDIKLRKQRLVTSPKIFSVPPAVTADISNLKRARQILAVHTDPDRFENSLPFIEKAMTEETDIIVPLNEYINCLMAIANKEDDSSYLQLGYEKCLQYKDYISKLIGIINVPVLNLCMKLEKNDEALDAANRILADPKINPEIRLNYILVKAKLLYDGAEQLGSMEGADPEKVSAAYESARLSYADWEQRFSTTPSVKSKANYNQIYYHTVLFNMAQCLIKLGEIDQAKAILKRVISYDPTNDAAKNLYMQLDSHLTMQGQEEAEISSIEQFDIDFLEDEEQEEEVSTLIEYTDVSGWKALNLTESDVLDYTFLLLARKQTPIALTYLKASSLLNDTFKNTYNILSYAANNPMEDLDYRQENIVLQFSNTDDRIASFTKFAQIAAVLRGTFYHTGQQDYFVASAYLDKTVLSNLPSLNSVLSMAESFRSEIGKGMDLYADYRFKVSSDTSSIPKTAQELHERYFGRLFHENVAQKRFKLTKAIVFEKGSMLEELLLCIINNDLNRFKQLSNEFNNMFIRDGAVLSPDNIDAEKIEIFIDEAWKKAGKDDSIHERLSSTLMGSLRNNIRIPINRIVELVCEWAVMNQSDVDNDSKSEKILYCSMRTEILSNLKQAIQELSCYDTGDSSQVAAGITVLTEVVEDLTERLEGTKSEEHRKYYFVDFLRTDYIMLDEANMPDLTFTFCDLPTFNILARIRAHAEAEESDMIEHARSIFTRDPDKHDFGTAEKISEYLHYTNRDQEWKMPENSETFNEQAKKQLRDCYDKFNIDLASAVSRGQINPSNDFLRTLEDTAQSLYQSCISSKNYGFFVRFVNLCAEMIHTSALDYEAVLITQLEKLAQDENMDEATYSKISEYINEQMFTVAEELMNRFFRGIEFVDDIPERGVLGYLDQFWEEFDDNYNALARFKGSSLAQILPRDKARKDTRGGTALVNNWPKNNGCSEEQISTLLGLLGWQDVAVSKCDNLPNVTGFLVKQSDNVFSLREYPHPIAAFGSQSANDGFYVICLFGTTDSGRLLDICKRLDSVNGNKIVLIDFVLTAGERRRLAKLMKQSNFANTYLFVDRVSLLYLANHFVGGIGESNNRALFAISMPFTYYQPYGTGSSSATAPELFSGRKEELRSVEDPQGANIIYGGRQLGKTAILKKAVQETHDPENGRYAFAIDIKEKNCPEAALKVSRWLSQDGILTESQITDDWDTFAFNLRKNIKEKSISYILLMLDEADCFIDDCKQYEYAPFVALKDLQQSLNGKFKFVLAGLHNLVKFKRDVSLGNNSVIAHLSFINVKPFDEMTARTLLREPLGYLGFDFEDDEASFMQIGSATNYYPGLIQLFCHKLIDGLKKNYAGYSETDTPGYKVESKHISKVLADKDFLAEIKNKFEITLRLGEGHYYYLLALLLGMLYEENESADGYDINAILDMEASVGIDVFKKLPLDQTNALLDELCDLNILKPMGNGYAFRTKSFRDLLGSKDELLEQLLSLLVE